MKDYLISGIQQVGIGTVDFYESWKWYIEMFQVDVKILEDDTVAAKMLPYTGNQPQKRHACIAINLQGGGGFEIWQYSDRQPVPMRFPITIGDLGIFVAKIKSRNVPALHQTIKARYQNVGELSVTPDGKKCFYLQDPFQNYFQVIEDDYIYIDEKKNAGGTVGAMIGVSDIERALPVYQDILGYDTVVYDRTDIFEDWQFLNGSMQKYRRVLLTHSEERKGAFAPLFGRSSIELVVAMDRVPQKIFENRFWGDPGFIQVCFDVANMKALGEYCASKGFPFTVDSCADQSEFNMGDASGHFTYIEDPDGTLIEFVETHEVPIIKKLGWSIHLLKRDRSKALPKFLLKCMKMNKVKIK